MFPRHGRDSAELQVEREGEVSTVCPSPGLSLLLSSVTTPCLCFQPRHHLLQAGLSMPLWALRNLCLHLNTGLLMAEVK